MARTLFENAVLSVEGCTVPLVSLGAGEELLVFSVPTAATRALIDRLGRLGLIQTPRGVVLMRARIQDVDVTAGTLRLVPADRQLTSRLPVCALPRLSAARRGLS